MTDALGRYVEVRLGGLLKSEVAGAVDGRILLEAAVGTSVADALARIPIADSDSLLVIVNEQVVPVPLRDRQRLAAGDRLIVMPPLQGG